jgi:hypothetical protein
MGNQDNLPASDVRVRLALRHRLRLPVEVLAEEQGGSVRVIA